MLAKKHNLSIFILFGSRVDKNKVKTTSDWDFAYYSKELFSADKDIALFNDLMELLQYEKIDLINLKKSKKLTVNNNIFQKGILIYENKTGFFDKKKWDTWFDLQDFKRYYEMQSEITRKKVEEMIC